MKNIDFKNFLIESSVMAMACDGEIAEEEIIEIKNIVANEIYFMGYEYEEPLKRNIENIKVNGKNAINQYLLDIESKIFNEHQELLIIEVILRLIEADNKVEEIEIKFLHMVKAKLKIEDQTLIEKFPNHFNYLMDFVDLGLIIEFKEEIKVVKDFF
jgi:uncharacterized tellurite resistance protein B-like protein